MWLASAQRLIFGSFLEKGARRRLIFGRNAGKSPQPPVTLPAAQSGSVFRKASSPTPSHYPVGRR
eukprot:4506574-Prymnesium_polylepis.1